MECVTSAYKGEVRFSYFFPNSPQPETAEVFELLHLLRRTTRL
jgi:hypothetical protein